MARIFRPYYTKRIPPGAPLVEHNGAPGIWVDGAAGPRFAPVAGEDMTRVRVPVEDWYIEYADAGGKQRREKVGPDRQDAEAALAAAQAAARLQRASLQAMRVGKAALAAQTPHAIRPKKIASEPGLLELDLTLFPFVSAVYFLSHRGEVVYVGQSVNFLRRVVKHMEDKVFDAVSYIPTPADRLIEVEQDYIRRLRPKYNQDESGVVRFGWVKGRAKAKSTR